MKRQQPVVRQEVRIVNELGLHARPAAEFVRVANIFRSKIWLVKGQQKFSATSIVEVLTADLCHGDIAVLEAMGPDSADAVAQLVELIRKLSD
ncbi:MAG TPA: HPr family phosphocarrier protein [Chthoniobacterales bacterium]|nr:HPr family phosphocarrier protein [Chthoniobacterales bacterium]